MSQEKLFSPSAERNQAPILKALEPLLPASGLVLEIASGTGQHGQYFSAHLPQHKWQPTDPDESAHASIAARVSESGLTNLLLPKILDVEQIPWPVDQADAIFCANMLHIAPWSAGLALLRGAAAILKAQAPLVLYGPFLRANVQTAAGNLAFDEDLRRRNPAWGIRQLAAVQDAASSVGFTSGPVVEMPANNLMVVLTRVAASSHNS